MDADLFRRMQEAAARFKSGASDFEEILTPAGPAHLVRDNDDPRGFRIDFVGEGARHQVSEQHYPPSRARPPGYPAPLPFLEDVHAIVRADDHSITWVDAPAPDSLFERLAREMVEEGWKVVAAVDPRDTRTGADGVTRVLEKDGVRRDLRLEYGEGEPRLLLRERGKPPPRV